MSTGVYGIQRPADINPALDTEIYYHYSPSRDAIGNNELIKLDASEVLIKTNNPNRSDPSQFELMGGLYTLKLKKEQFANLGYYTIIIKPREIRTKILDCSTLSSNQSVRGIIFDLAQVPADVLANFENNGLVGFRIEYLNVIPSNDSKITNLTRIITSSNRAEPVLQNLSNSNQKNIAYRLNDSSNLVFCTVSPSSSSSIKPNVFPFIGSPNQDVILTNTLFNPISIEIETVEHDIQTLSYMAYSNQIKNMETGTYTIFNNKNEIFFQADLYEIKDEFGKSLYEVKQKKINIDFSQNFNDITNI